MVEHTAHAFDVDLQELARKIAEMGGLADNARTSAEGVFRAVEPEGIASASREASLRSGGPGALRTTAASGGDRFPVSGFAVGSAKSPFRSHSLPLCRFHLFRSTAAIPGSRPHRGTAPAERLSGNRHSRAAAGRCCQAAVAADWRPANLPEKGGATRLKGLLGGLSHRTRAPLGAEFFVID